MHALAELDPDRLLASLTSLGFDFKQTPEPFDALRTLLCAPQTQARRHTPRSPCPHSPPGDPPVPRPSLRSPHRDPTVTPP